MRYLASCIGASIIAVSLAGPAASSTPAATPSPWRSPEAVSAPDARAGGSDVVSNRRGDAVAAWVEPLSDGRWAVRAAVRSFGSAWQPPHTLASPSTSQPPRPDAAVDEAGNVAVTWESAVGDESRVLVAVRPAATGAWLPSEAVSPASTVAEAPAAVFDGASNLVVAWLGRPAGAPISAARVETSRRDASTAGWTTPQPLSEAGASALELESNAEGMTLASWRVGSPQATTYQTALFQVGVGWSDTESLPAPQPRVLDITIGPGGRLVAVGPARTPDRRPVAMTAAARPPGGVWSDFRPISSTAGTLLVQDARVAIDASGRSTASWQRTIRRGDRNIATVVAAGQRLPGVWRPPVQVSEPGLVAFTGDLAVNADGTAVAIWTRPQGSRRAVHAAVRLRPGQSWLAPERVTPFLRDYGGPGATESVLLDGRGTATALWIGGGRLRASDRMAGAPGTVRLTATQLLINQRVAQAAIRRADALRREIESGLDSTHLRRGSLTPERFGPSVETGGAYTGALVPPGPAIEIAVPGSRPDRAGRVTLSARQLLINQRIGQAAVLRANALQNALADGLPEGAFRPAGIVRDSVSPGVEILATRDPGPPAPPVPISVGSPGRGSGQVRLTAQQLVINQRIYQAAIIRLNALRARIGGRLSGADVGRGAISARQLAP